MNIIVRLGPSSFSHVLVASDGSTLDSNSALFGRSHKKVVAKPIPPLPPNC